MPTYRPALESMQKDLFALGARLADPSARIASRVEKAAVSDADVERLEAAHRSAGGRTASAEAIHPSWRIAGRRAAASGAHDLPPRRTAGDRARSRTPSSRSSSCYLNRLSDLLFVMARAVNHHAGAARSGVVTGPP